MAGYTPHLQRQVRHTICRFYIWKDDSRKWWVLPVRSKTKLISMENWIQLWNTIHSRRRDGPRENRRPELLPMITWRSTWGHVSDPNNWDHHGKHPTSGWYLWKHKFPQTIFNTPRISNTAMETSRPYFLSIGRLPINWLGHVASTRISIS